MRPAPKYAVPDHMKAQHAEDALIAGVFAEPSTLDAVVEPPLAIRPDDFYAPLNAETWRAMLAVVGDGGEPSFGTVVARLTTEGKLKPTDYEALDRLANDLEASGANVMVNANDVKRRAVQRRANERRHDLGLLMQNPAATNGDLLDVVDALGAELEAYEPKSAEDDFCTFADLPDAEAVAQLVNGIMLAQSLNVIYGPPGSGKTALVLGMMFALQAGFYWDTGNAQTIRTRCAYLCGEGLGGIKARAAAWCASHNITLDEVAPGIFKGARNLRDPDEALYVVNRLRRAWQLADPSDSTPKALFIDTLSRNFGGGNENAPEDMGAFIAGVDTIQRALGCSVTVLHHVGKDATKGSRGHSSLAGAADGMWETKGDATGVCTFKCAKAKDLRPFAPVHYTIEEVELSEGRTSIVAVPSTVGTVEAKNTEAGGEILRVIDEWDGPFGPTWEEDFEPVLDMTRPTFQRRVKELIDGGLIESVPFPTNKRRKFLRRIEEAGK